MKIKLGIIGLGRAGRGMHLNEIENSRDMFEITAVCDCIKERADEVAARYGCRAYYNIGDFLADDGFEMADIATRSCDHCRHAIMSMEAGKHVLLEKPMSTDLSEAMMVYEAGERLHRKLYIRHNRRWEGPFNQALSIINSGIIGDVFEVRLTRNEFETRNDWQTLRKYGGGQLLNWGPHIIDQALIFGEGYTDIYCNIKQINASGDCEDHIKIVFTGKNKRIIDMEISGGCALSLPLYTAYGTKGSFEIYNDRTELKYVNRNFNIIKYKANEGTPGVYFANSDDIPWVTETVPTVQIKLDQVWKAVYDDFNDVKPYRITKEQALTVMEVIIKVKQYRVLL
ncbi:MAG: Gfo/Idh/MocA family protein [Eubacteriales bacterium]